MTRATPSHPAHFFARPRQAPLGSAKRGMDIGLIKRLGDVPYGIVMQGTDSSTTGVARQRMAARGTATPPRHDRFPTPLSTNRFANPQTGERISSTPRRVNGFWQPPSAETDFADCAK